VSVCWGEWRVMRDQERLRDGGVGEIDIDLFHLPWVAIDHASRAVCGSGWIGVIRCTATG
jgi:hypothetical protein